MSTKAKVSANPKSTKKELTDIQLVNVFKNEIRSISYCVKSINDLFHTTIETKNGKIHGSKLAYILIPNWKNNMKFDLNLFMEVCKNAGYMINGKIATYTLINVTFDKVNIFSDAACTKAVKVYALNEVNSWSETKVINLLNEIAKKQANIVKRNSEKTKAAKALTSFYYQKPVETPKVAPKAQTATTKAREKAANVADKVTYFVKNAIVKVNGTNLIISNKDYTTGTAKVNTKINEILSKESLAKAKEIAEKVDAEIAAKKAKAEENKEKASVNTEKAANA